MYPRIREFIPTGVLIRLADLYRVSVDYLLGQTDNPVRNK